MNASVDLESIKRPPFLSRILDYKSEKDSECKEMYQEFLNFAEAASRECISKNLSFAANYKLAGIPQVPEFVGFNDNLMVVFSFYSKIQQLSHGGTFSAKDAMNETMNFKKFEIFCRDFKLIPKLLIRDDIKLVWEMMSYDWVQAGKGSFTAIGFPEFKDLIVRMALLAYHKPGIKKLILLQEGFMPKNVDLVGCFCTYLHLHDVEYIVNFIRTVGRQTQGDYNFKSKGDAVNQRTLLEIISDKTARKLSQVNHTTAKAAPPTDQRPKKKEKRDFHDPDTDHKLDKEHYHSFGGPAVVDSGAPKKGYNPFGEKIVEPLCIFSANPKYVISFDPSERSKTADGLRAKQIQHSRIQTLPVKMQMSLLPESHDGTGYLPPIVQQLVINMDGSQAGGSAGGSLMGSGRGNNPPEDLFTVPRQHQRFMQDMENVEDSRSDTSVVSSTLSTFVDNSLECLKDSLERDYDPQLVRELARYCYTPPKVVLSDTVYLGGPFVDLGLLSAGSKVTINLTVTNATADELHIDATTRNFKSHDTDLKTFSKALVPGFSRSVKVTFTVEPKKKVVLAFLDVISIAVRNGENSCISCPVFYRVDPMLDKDNMPKATSENLYDLMGQFCDDRDRRLNTSFQRLKVEGSWKNKTGTSNATRSFNVSSDLALTAKPRTVKVYTTSGR